MNYGDNVTKFQWILMNTIFKFIVNQKDQEIIFRDFTPEIAALNNLAQTQLQNYRMN